MPKAKPFITRGVENVIPALEAVNSASEVFPPLRSAVSGTLFILQAFKEYKSNQSDWKAFTDYVAQAVVCVSAAVSRSGQPSLFDDALKELKVVLDEIVLSINDVPEAKATGRWTKKAASFLKDRNKIPALEVKLNRALQRFNLGATIKAHNDLADVLSNTGDLLAGIKDITKNVNKLEQGKQRSDLDLTLRQLHCATQSSRDSEKECYPGTRSEVLAVLEAFASAAGGSSVERVLLLTGVAGCGKTAIAQSVARLFDQPDWTRPRLGVCFNFTAQVEDRRTTQLLFSTTAFALSELDPKLKESIAKALSQRPTLASSASSIDQFQELIETPLRNFAVSTPHRIVFVFDALDEINKRDLNPFIDILANKFSQLPSSCRVIITSRPDRDIVHRLKSSPHVVWQKIHHNDPASLRDIRRVARSRLRAIAGARRSDLEASWPDPEASWPGLELEERLIQKVGGLFVWLDVVCKAVLRSADPTYELTRLLEGDDTEPDMDSLYCAVLDACWPQKDFSRNYRLVVGTILALKTPLSAGTIARLLDGLLGKTPIDVTLEPIASVLVGVSISPPPSSSGPRVEISHESFRAFATREDGAGVPEDQKKYLVDEAESSRRLAMQCLLVINDELPQHSDLLASLFDDSQAQISILSPSDGVVSEALEYACEYWISHLQVVVDADAGFADTLRHFLRENLLRWMQLCASRLRFQGIGVLRTWLDKSYPQCGISFASETDLKPLSHFLPHLEARLKMTNRWEEALAADQLSVYIERQLVEDDVTYPTIYLAKALHRLSACHAAVGQPDDAVVAGHQAVEVFRQIAVTRLPKAYVDLAMSLSDLSLRAGAVNRGEESLNVGKEAVQIYRSLMADHPASFTSDLSALFSASLHSLAASLDGLGLRKEALSISREAVEIRRQLAIERPAAFNPDLSASLHKLSDDLAGLGFREEALSASREAVEIRRQLSTTDLAASLHLMSMNLLSVGRREEALSPAQESVEIRRQLATARPAVHKIELARSLHTLSAILCDLGRQQEALSPSQEAVEILRQLAVERPAASTCDLAASLTQLSMVLSNLARPEEALTAAQQAVDLHRQLAADRPAKFNSGLALSLYNISLCLSQLGEADRALNALQESGSLYRLLAAEIPAVHTVSLAKALDCLADNLERAGKLDEAAAAREEKNRLSEAA